MTETVAFSNKEQASDELEAPAAMNFEPLSPAYKKMLMVSILLVLLVVVAVNLAINLVAAGSLQPLLTIVGAAGPIGVVLLGAILVLTLPKMLWQSKGYQLREQDIHFRHGIIWHHVTSLPYVRIQHVELESGPVERYFKLATLKFYTAGGGAADMRIPGLPYAVASKLRSFVISRAGASDTGSPQTAGHAGGSHG